MATLAGQERGVSGRRDVVGWIGFAVQAVVAVVLIVGSLTEWTSDRALKQFGAPSISNVRGVDVAQGRIVAAAVLALAALVVAATLSQPWWVSTLTLVPVLLASVAVTPTPPGAAWSRCRGSPGLSRRRDPANPEWPPPPSSTDCPPAARGGGAGSQSQET